MMELMEKSNQLREEQQEEGNEEGVCLIDYGEYPPEEISHVGCNHPFCNDCFHEFLEEKVKGGPMCIFSTCPMDGCPYYITEQVVQKFATGDSFNKFQKFKLENFVKHAANLISCKGVDCDQTFYIQEKQLDREFRCPQTNGLCTDCGYVTCLRCDEPGHEPLNCVDYKEWIDNIETTFKTLTGAWINMNTKPCPACKVPIEKN